MVQSQRAEIVTTSPHGFDRRCNVIFTCFSKFYLFLFPILRQCTLVKYHCGIFIEQQAQQSASGSKEYSATVLNSASVPNSASALIVDNASRYKVMKESQKPLKIEFNQSKAKANDNCSKLLASDSHESKLDLLQASEPTLSPPASKKQSCNKKRAIYDL